MTIRHVTGTLLAAAALLLVAAPAAAAPPPDHVTVAWLTPEGATPDAGDPAIWPQTYLAHVETKGVDLEALDHLEIECGRVVQIDGYRYASKADRRIVDELIAGGVLDLVNGTPADSQVVVGWKFLSGPECEDEEEPPPTTIPEPDPCPYDDALEADDAECLEPPPVTEPQVTVPATTPDTVPSLECPTGDEGYTVRVSYDECPPLHVDEPVVAGETAAPAELPRTGVGHGVLVVVAIGIMATGWLLCAAGGRRDDGLGVDR